MRAFRSHRRLPGAALVGAGLLLLGACVQLPSIGLRPKPIADRPIDLVGSCARREDDGFREDASVRIVDSRVEALRWRLWVGQRGGCAFDLDGFRQTRSRPHIELRARDGSDCLLMVWRDPRRVTLAHAGCQHRCTAGIYDQAWPVMFDPVTGGCGGSR